ncbi:MAG TPA: hypothetical protein VI756_05975 [Blastocatellia bacterium]
MGSIIRASAALLLVVCYSLPGRDYGPAIGARMPAFELMDQEGRPHTLGNLLGPQGAVILFYRSADW